MIDFPALEKRLGERRRAAMSMCGFHSSAVLVPILVEPGEPERLVFIERPSHLRAHAGQVAFPGGRTDPEDRDAAATAIRETSEEIGLAPSSIHVLGLLDDVPTPSGYVITPVVARVAGPVDMTPSPDEVAALFLAEIAELRHPDRYTSDGERDFLGLRYTLHSYRWSRWRIWGATARIVHQLFALLDGEP